jgi:hypothetical protein
LVYQRPADVPPNKDHLPDSRAVWTMTVELYQQVAEILGGDDHQPRALQLLSEAQQALLETPRQLDIALQRVGQVQSLVAWRRNVNRWASSYGWGILAYETAWIGLMGWGVVAATTVVNAILKVVGSAQGLEPALGLWGTTLWGGLGGALGALYSLYRHVAKTRDFDKRYTMWYVVQPVIGLLLGALVYLLVGSGFQTGQGANQDGAVSTFSLFSYAVACIAGYGQRTILEAIDQAIQMVVPWSQRNEPPSAAGAVKESQDRPG